MIWAFIDKFYQIIIAVLLALLLLVLIGFGIQSWRIKSYKTDYLQLKAKYDVDIAESKARTEKAKADAAMKEKSWAEQITKAEQNYNVQIQQVQRDADIASSSADSLSKQLATAKQRMPKATPEARTEYTDTLSDVFQECIIANRSLAETTDRHTADEKRLIDAWPEEKALR